MIDRMIILPISVFEVAVISLLLLCPITIVYARQNEGYDLDSDSSIRIGIMKRIPKKLCQ